MEPRRPPGRRLTARQRQVLYFHVAGYPCDRIAAALGVSKNTVKWHLFRITRVLLPGVTDQPGIVRRVRLAYLMGLLDGGVAPEHAADYLASLASRAMLLAAHVHPRGGADANKPPSPP